MARARRRDVDGFAHHVLLSLKFFLRPHFHHRQPVQPGTGGDGWRGTRVPPDRHPAGLAGCAGGRGSARPEGSESQISDLRTKGEAHEESGPILKSEISNLRSPPHGGTRVEFRNISFGYDPK